jgi:hypothetical protein
MMPSGSVHQAGPGSNRHAWVVAPTTQIGKWAVGLIAAIVPLVVAVFTVVPDDSIAAVVVLLSLLGLTVAGGIASVGAIRQGERALSVYAAALVLAAGVLLVLLHSLFIND